MYTIHSANQVIPVTDQDDDRVVVQLDTRTPLHAGVRITRENRITDGVRITNGVRITRGVRITNGVRITRGVRITSGVRITLAA